MDPFIGSIILFAGNFPPRGWAFCDGQLISINENSALFSILGTTYGGDGRSTFALPDLRGRAPIHPGHGPGLTQRNLGQKFGAEGVALTISQMPSHNHQVQCKVATGDLGSPKNNFPAGDNAGKDKVYSATRDTIMNPDMIESVGSGAQHENVQPCLGINYIIAMQGTFPSRS